MFLVPTYLGRLANHCDHRDSGGRWGLGGVRVEQTPTGFRAIATDTKGLVIVSGPCPNPDEHLAAAALATAPNGETGATVPEKEWARVFRDAARLTGRKSVPDRLKVVAVQPAKEITTLFANNTESTVQAAPRNVEGRFPPVDEVMRAADKEGAKGVVTVWAKQMAEFFATAAAYMEGNDAGDGVRLEVFEGKVRLTAERGDGTKFQSLVMGSPAR